MSDYQNLTLRALDSDHDRLGFDCGVTPLNSYIKKQASQDVRRHISRVFVATTVAQPNSVLGYYTLSSLSLELSHLPQALARKLPQPPIPAALLGRLAVKQAAQGYGVGRILLVDAIKRTLAVSAEIAIYAMVVDAIDARAQAFYEQFGFSRLGTENQRLFLPLKSIAI